MNHSAFLPFRSNLSRPTKASLNLQTATIKLPMRATRYALYTISITTFWFFFNRAVIFLQTIIDKMKLAIFLLNVSVIVDSCLSLPLDVLDGDHGVSCEQWTKVKFENATAIYF